MCVCEREACGGRPCCQRSQNSAKKAAALDVTFAVLNSIMIREGVVWTTHLRLRQRRGALFPVVVVTHSNAWQTCTLDRRCTRDVAEAQNTGPTSAFRHCIIGRNAELQLARLKEAQPKRPNVLRRHRRYVYHTHQVVVAANTWSGTGFALYEQNSCPKLMHTITA